MIKITMSIASYCFVFIQKTTNGDGFKSVKSEATPVGRCYHVEEAGL